MKQNRYTFLLGVGGIMIGGLIHFLALLIPHKNNILSIKETALLQIALITISNIFKIFGLGMFLGAVIILIYSLLKKLIVKK